MKLFDLRKKLKLDFEKHQIDTADVDFIIAEILNVSRTELVLIDEVEDKTVEEIKTACEQRLNNVPVDSIFKKAYFYGLTFKVDENVLTPRSETELLVEKAIKLIKENNYHTVLDLCCGSGCLAISIKKNVPVEMTASDVSSKALKLAKQNAKDNQVEVNFKLSNMFEKIDDKFDLIVSNPPYIDTEEINYLSEEVKNFDPRIALDGGALGLKFYNIIHNNLRKHLNESGRLIVEIGEDQKDMILSLFNDFTCEEIIQDYNGIDRFMVFKK